MPGRMTVDEFFKHCGQPGANGYPLKTGESMPETHDELVKLVGTRLGITEQEISIQGLSAWLSDDNRPFNPCSPEIDMQHAEAVVLISALSDPDGYVAALPDTGGFAVLLPPPTVVRDLIILEGMQT